MNESSNSPQSLTQFPRSTNRLLSPSEKVFIDRFPDDLVKAVFEFDDSSIKAKILGEDGVEAIDFMGERAVAVRDYLEMQIAYGLRNDPR